MSIRPLHLGMLTGLLVTSSWLTGPVLSVVVADEPAAAPASLVRYIAIDNVCAWPNLTRLPDGSMAAVIHNRPSHGGMEGDVECWVSSTGEFWELRGRPAPNDPQTVRMNVAAGLAKNGDLLVLCSGKVVTAYYAKRVENHERYHMGVAIWQPATP